MPSKTALCLLLAACATDPIAQPLDAPTPTVASPAQEPPPKSQGDAFCDHRLYRCAPNDPGAQHICDYACLLPSYCQDYTPGDYRHCANHPDTFDRYYRYCDPQGNPTWNTYCVGGDRP